MIARAEEINLPPVKAFFLITTGIATLTSPMSAAISVVDGLPNGALFSNPSVAESGEGDGTTRLGAGAWVTKGNSFILPSASSITSVTFRIDEAGGTFADSLGSVALDFYNLSGTPDDIQNTGQHPTGASLYSQTETLPNIAPGDYLTITLDTPLDLNAGNYAFALTGIDIDLHLDINNELGNTTFSPGDLVRFRPDQQVWQDRNFDVVFAIGAIPEPATSLLAGIALLGALRRRSRR